MTLETFDGFEIELRDGIAHLQIRRPDRGNALNAEFWNAIPGAIKTLDRAGEVRAMIVSSTGAIFCAGMDIEEFASGIPDTETPGSREAFYHLAISLQETFNAFEQTRFPVIGVVQGACLGAGLELACAFDLRLVTTGAYFRLEEINTGIMADVGALQRLPKMLPDAVMKEMAFLGKKLTAERAHSIGFVNGVFEDQTTAINVALSAAGAIAHKAPVAVAGTKAALRFARDHSVPDALEWSARTQSALWSTSDIKSAITARQTKSTPSFEDLKRKPRIGDAS